MQKSLFLLCFVAILACKPSSPAETTTGTETASMEAPANGSNPYRGSWVEETYYNSVITDKSPRIAQELIDECYIMIPDTGTELMRMGYNWHEIGPELRFVTNGDSVVLWETQGDTLHKAAYTVVQPDPQHLLLNDKRFVKVDMVHINNLPLVLEAILFKGTYTDANGNTVTFTPEGTVTGLGRFSKYHVRADYMDMGMQVDQVGFKEEGAKPVYYAFKYQGNQLELFELKCTAKDQQSGLCAEVTFGKKLHTLTKQS